jgi:hypothetical protein
MLSDYSVGNPAKACVTYRKVSEYAWRGELFLIFTNLLCSLGETIKLLEDQ